MKNLECPNCVIASSQNSNSFLERFDRMNPWRRRRNFKPMKLQNSLVGTNAFIKDSLRQCARLVKAFGTKLSVGLKLDRPRCTIGYCYNIQDPPLSGIRTHHARSPCSLSHRCKSRSLFPVLLANVFRHF